MPDCIIETIDSRAQFDMVWESWKLLSESLVVGVLDFTT